MASMQKDSLFHNDFGDEVQRLPDGVFKDTQIDTNVSETNQIITKATSKQDAHFSSAEHNNSVPHISYQNTLTANPSRATELQPENFHPIAISHPLQHVSSVQHINN